MLCPYFYCHFVLLYKGQASQGHKNPEEISENKSVGNCELYGYILIVGYILNIFQFNKSAVFSL